MWDLREKVAIVTGGGLGIGAGISEVLAAAGAKVAVAEINPSTAAATIKQDHETWATRPRFSSMT